MLDQNQNQNGFYNSRKDPDYDNFYDAPQGGQENSYVNLYSEPGQPPKKPSGGKIFLKVIAAVAALAIVSVSSVELYKLFGADKSKTNWSSAAESEESTENAAAQGTTSNDNEVNSKAAAKTSGSAASWVSMAAPADALTIPEIVDKAMPSAVGISSTFEYTSSGMTGYWGFGFYDNYGGNSGQKQTFSATGSGIVMSEDGYIITNAHVIYDDESQYKAGKATAVSVVMGDENKTEYEAQIVGYDLQTDLAVLKIDATGLSPAEFGNSDDLQVGELVVAIGNPLGFELYGTTTCGIVSALNREVTINEKEMTLIQTDAAINAGNSGGPLLNAYGQVIGINSAKMGSSYGSASVEGLGFAIPISDAKEIIDSLINNGYVTGRPQFGITGVTVTEADAERFNIPQGVYVYAVGDGSAAAQAGIQQGDIITAIEGTTVTTMDALNEVKNQYNAGDTVKLTISRSGQSIEVSLTLQEVQQEN